MKETKKYRLAKDLPDAEAGTIFEYTEDGYYTALIPGEDGICGKWPPHYVHCNSKWFEPIEQDAFVGKWSDEEVKEIIRDIQLPGGNRVSDLDLYLSNFKTSKSAQSKAPIWYTTEEVYKWLISLNYNSMIANELAEAWTNSLQDSFKKGWEKGYNDNKSGTFDYKYMPPSTQPVEELKMFTKQELEDAFNAAREVLKNNQTGVIKFYEGDTLPYSPNKYSSFQDYLKSKK